MIMVLAPDKKVEQAAAQGQAGDPTPGRHRAPDARPPAAEASRRAAAPAGSGADRAPAGDLTSTLDPTQTE